MSTSMFFKPRGNAVIPPPPPSPTSEDPIVKQQTEEAMAKASEGERKVKGRASTILTSGMGLEDKPASSRKVLWGA